MDMDKRKTVSFCGYRPQKFEFPLSNNDDFETLVHVNFDVIMQAIDSGYNDFIVGCEPGFDILCAELVRLAKEVVTQNINMICVLPYNDFSASNCFNDGWKSRYDSIIEDCCQIINITGKDHETDGCYQLRNEFMIDNSNRLICYNTSMKGNTASTVRYAEDKGLEIINVADLLI